jgi:NAD(P)-dependent dehydrogenase (short-subunit alcohol dehydrogenase family)
MAPGRRRGSVAAMHTSDTPNARTAIITGASRGLGLALARALARQGHRLVIDARSFAELDVARAQLAELTDVVAVPGDVADASHRRALVEAAGERVDILVNNAGTLGATPLPALADYPLDELERAFAVNTIAPLALAQLALPLMPAGGRIVNITSDAAVESYAGWGGYSASKAALDRLSGVLGAERPDLRVYAVDPGDMNTRMQQEGFPGEDVSGCPPPEDSVPGLLVLIQGDVPSGRYRAAELVGAQV